MNDPGRRILSISFPVYTPAGYPIEAPRLLWACNRLMRQFGCSESNRLVVLMAIGGEDVEYWRSQVLLHQLAAQFDQDDLPLDVVGIACEGSGSEQ